jgi:hypothetical protein
LAFLDEGGDGLHVVGVAFHEALALGDDRRFAGGKGRAARRQRGDHGGET